MKIATIIKNLEAHKVKIAKERNQLRDFLLEIEELKECCEMAHEDIDSAIDKLSELV